MVEKNKEEENTPMSSETIVKLIGIFAVFLVMLVYIIATGKANNDFAKKLSTIKINDLVTLANNVGDNYTMDIKKELNDKTYSFSYSTDGQLTTIIGDIIDKEGILIYGDKYFYLISKTKELKPYKGDTSFANDLYYDYSFIKSLIPSCKLEQISDYKVRCNISNDIYLEAYNKKQETNLEELEGDVVLIISYNSSYITSVLADYSSFNSALNGTDDSVNYVIKINSVGLNNFSSLLDYYKSVLEK